MKRSIAMAVPTAFREDANRTALAMGFDNTALPGASFSLPLSNDGGGATVTHYGCRATASDGFVLLMQQAALGNLPEGVAWDDFDLTPETVIAAVQAVDMDPKTQAELDAAGLSYGGHFAAFLTARGLVVVDSDAAS